jgi:microcystin-dependent protein
VANPFVAEIRIFPFNFPPKGWAICNGQLLPIGQNTALFSLVGTTYGGDGKSTFGLPNLQGSAPMQWGQGPGLSLRDLGETGGEDMLTLLQSEMPAHGQSLMAGKLPSSLKVPDPARVLSRSTGGNAYTAPNNDTFSQMYPLALGIYGANFPHNNLQPYLVMNFCIALQGVFPARG